VVTPWKSGFRLGGRLELSGFDTSVRDRHLQLLKNAYLEYFHSGLKPGPEEAWAGLRPMTCDDLPVLGRTRRYPNLYLATGHNMLGLTMAPGTGEVLADLITGQPPSLDVSCFDPDRFGTGIF
jgi:D-amino-acid dehydrogenase